VTLDAWFDQSWCTTWPCLKPEITLATNYFRVLAVLLIHLLCFALLQVALEPCSNGYQQKVISLKVEWDDFLLIPWGSSSIRTMKQEMSTDIHFTFRRYLTKCSNTSCTFVSKNIRNPEYPKNTSLFLSFAHHVGQSNPSGPLPTHHSPTLRQLLRNALLRYLFSDLSILRSSLLGCLDATSGTMGSVS